MIPRTFASRHGQRFSTSIGLRIRNPEKKDLSPAAILPRTTGGSETAPETRPAACSPRASLKTGHPQSETKNFSVNSTPDFYPDSRQAKADIRNAGLERADA